MYCYVTMPFGLRNAGATYQRCMLHVFGDHLGRSVEAYVDDIVVKSRKADDLVADLRIAFDCLRAKGVKLNPEKCMPRGTPNTHFSGLSFTPLARRQSNPILRSATRSSAFLDLTTMSSTYASTLCPRWSPKMWSIHCWYVAPVFLRPKGIVT